MARLRIEADDSLRDEIDLQSVEYSTEQIDNMSDAEFSDIFGDVSRESVGGTPSGS